MHRGILHGYFGYFLFCAYMLNLYLSFLVNICEWVSEYACEFMKMHMYEFFNACIIACDCKHKIYEVNKKIICAQFAWNNNTLDVTSENCLTQQEKWSSLPLQYYQNPVYRCIFYPMVMCTVYVCMCITIQMHAYTQHIGKLVFNTCD